jgi:hypothetical protein
LIAGGFFNSRFSIFTTDERDDIYELTQSDEVTQLEPDDFGKGLILGDFSE